MKPGVVLAVLLALLATSAASGTGSTGSNGAKEITLNGGTRGTVHFPHAQHQIALEDCNTCHRLFPQTAGSIDALKTRGDLKKKQIMNKLCNKCHRDKRKAGLKTGPVTCSKCHQR